MKTKKRTKDNQMGPKLFRRIKTLMEQVSKDTRIPPASPYTRSLMISEILNRTEIVGADVIFVQATIESPFSRKTRQRFKIDNWEFVPPKARRYKERKKKKLWIIKLGQGRDKNGKLCFHSVVYLPDYEMIVDASIQDMSRPEYKIKLNPFIGIAKKYKQKFSPISTFRLFDVPDFLRHVKPFFFINRRDCEEIMFEYVQKYFGDYIEKYLSFDPSEAGGIEYEQKETEREPEPVAVEETTKEVAKAEETSDIMTDEDFDKMLEELEDEL